MVQHLLGRKGAARIALIPQEVLDALNAGHIATVNLNEFLALDLALLARNAWAAQWIAFSSLALADKLDAVWRFAADPHFGVREMAWMAVRDEIAGDVEQAVRLLQAWATHPDPNIRRFASEATRPRGVWCAQIEPLKKEPWRGLPLLEPLRADGSRYVQNSVANWLNDAAKTQPDWVREVCGRWSRGRVPPATGYIVRRAQRSLLAG